MADIQRPWVKWRSALDLAGALLVVVAAGVCIYAGVAAVRALQAAEARHGASAGPQRDAVPIPKAPVDIIGAATKGNPRAGIALIEFSDFQCPICSRLTREVLPGIEASYVANGNVLLVFEPLPLENIHPQALASAEAAVCAGDQGRFWEMHDLLFGDPIHLDIGSLDQRANRLGLSMDLFKQCMSGSGAVRVRKAEEYAKTLNLRGTPSLLVGILAQGGTHVIVNRVFSGLPAPSDLASALGVASGAHSQ